MRELKEIERDMAIAARRVEKARTKLGGLEAAALALAAEYTETAAAKAEAYKSRTGGTK